MAGERIRAFCLCLIVVQNSSLILVTSYSRHLEPAYLPSVAVFLAEVLKLLSVFLLLACETPGGFAEALRLSVALVQDHPWETAQFAVPALAYTLQNNLWYYALSNLDPITAAVTSQLKVITTAVASVMMLGRRLNHWQWCALTLLMSGMVVMQLKSSALHTPHAQEAGSERTVPRNTASGATAMLGSTMLSAYAGVYIERLFKTVKKTLWLQSIQLSVFSLPVSAACMLAFDFAAFRERRLMVGFTPLVWFAVSLFALGGIAVSMALKYADNIQKTFAVGISIVLNCVVSTVFLGVVGVAMVVSSTVWFNRAQEARPRPPADAIDMEEGQALQPNDGYREVAMDDSRTRGG